MKAPEHELFVRVEQPMHGHAPEQGLVLSSHADGALAKKISNGVRSTPKWDRWKGVPFLHKFQFKWDLVPGWLTLAPAKGLEHLSLAQG
jgi:hypothetical protein